MSGEPWELVIDAAAARRMARLGCPPPAFTVKSVCALLDGHPAALAAVLYAIAGPQARSRDVGPADFCRRVAGALPQARAAFVRALKEYDTWQRQPVTGA